MVNTLAAVNFSQPPRNIATPSKVVELNKKLAFTSKEAKTENTENERFIVLFLGGKEVKLPANITHRSFSSLYNQIVKEGKDSKDFGRSLAQESKLNIFA